MRYDQMPDGDIPWVIPDVKGQSGSPGYVDAATIVPWNVHLTTGDLEVLSDNYSMMEHLVAWYDQQAGPDVLLDRIGGFGDWLQPYRHNKRRGDTSSLLVGNAFYARSTWILAKSAEVLGREDDAQKYLAKFEEIKEAFTGRYLSDDGTIRMDADVGGRHHVEPETQAACLFALAFHLVPTEAEKSVVAQLVRLIDEADGHLRTGIQGTPLLVPTLDRFGQSDLAMDLLLKETYPSWLFSVKQGATTIWEHWNGYTIEDGFLDEYMNSFNHYAYGSIGQWMYERVAGLQPDPEHPGYNHFFINPLITEHLDGARAELETAYGKALGSWKRQGGQVLLEVIVPPNSSATLRVDGPLHGQELTAGHHQFTLTAP
jgi:alpha-L-rhamnosidase